MKLSDAIRLGAMLRGQAFGTLFDPVEKTSCALGAAGEAIGILDTSVSNKWKDNKNGIVPPGWFWVKRIVDCPVCGADFDAPLSFATRDRDVQAAIVHLNNDHRWTRERIADWVESIEVSVTVDAFDPHVAGPGTLTTRV